MPQQLIVPTAPGPGSQYPHKGWYSSCSGYSASFWLPELYLLGRHRDKQAHL